MTYNVFGGTLNFAHINQSVWNHWTHLEQVAADSVIFEVNSQLIELLACS